MADQLFGVAELGFYRRVFDAAELEEGQFLGGAKGAELLAKSNLPRKTLHEIWNVADARNEGRLDFSAFCVACRLAAHAQQGLPVSAESVNQDPVAPLQLFGSARPTPTTSPKMASSSSSTGQQANIDWRPSDGELQQYLQVFRGLQLEQVGAIAGSQAPQGYLEKGEPVRQLFAKAGVSPLELDALWSLADADGDGLLSVKEFCVAMNLITKCQKQKTAIPVEIPTDATNFSLPASSPVPVPASSSGVQLVAGGGGGASSSSTSGAGALAAAGSAQSSAATGEAGPRPPTLLVGGGSASSSSSKANYIMSPGTPPSLPAAQLLSLSQSKNGEILEQPRPAPGPMTVNGSVPMGGGASPLAGCGFGEGEGASKAGNGDDGDSAAASGSKIGGSMLDRAWRAEARINGQGMSGPEIEFLEERANLELQMRRKRDFERAIIKLRNQIEDLQTHQGMKDVERAKLSHRMDELQMSHEFLRAQIEAVENDLLLLSELHPNVRSSPQEAPASENQSFEEFRTKALQTVRIDREMARIDNQKIEELRVKLKSMDREKKSLGQKNAVLLEKFRQIEQDRSLLMASVDTERSKLLLLREERLKLMNERCQLKATEAKLNQELASKPTYLQQAKPQNDLMSFGSLEQVGPAKQWQAFGNSGTTAAASGGTGGLVAAGAATNTGVDWTSNFNGPTKWESFKN